MADRHWKLKREPAHLDSLSVKYKWESTRRHPLYLRMWKTFQALQASATNSLEPRRLVHPAISGLGELIGINGSPVDPALEFDELIDSETNILWLKRAARPVSFRSVATLLLANLEPDTLRLLSECFSQAANSGDLRQSLFRLGSAKCPELDFLVDTPLYLLNPAAPAEEFTSDLRNLRNEWRERQGLPETRVNEKKYPSYLRAWDLREGWSGGAYHRDSVLSMKDVAEELGKNKTSARNWYRSGFKLVTGHEFTVENWLDVMGVDQLSGLLGETVHSAFRRRSMCSSSPRPVDDTTISGGQNHPGDSGVVDGLAAQQDQADVQRMLLRILQLIDEGRSNQEILDDLELEVTALPAIEKIRETREI